MCKCMLELGTFINYKSEERSCCASQVINPYPALRAPLSIWKGESAPRKTKIPFPDGKGYGAAGGYGYISYKSGERS